MSYPLGVFGFIALSYSSSSAPANAVNLTDGLTALAIMPAGDGGSALGLFAYVTGNAVYLRYLGVPAHSGCRRTDRVLLGAGRRRPRLPVVQRLPGPGVHGDVGALALGGALARSRWSSAEIVLAIMGGCSSPKPCR